MYKLLLISKYLRKRRIAWVSLVAVTLCTAMVLVVISVMGGWLRMFRETNHALTGDLMVYRYSLDGFGHYEELINQIEQLPEVKAASPQIQTYALINIDNQIRTGVQVIGYDMKSIAPVNGFVPSLYLQPDKLLAKADLYESQATTQSDSYEPPDILKADAAALRAKANSFPSWDKLLAAEQYRERLPNSKVDPAGWPGMVVGSGVIGLERDDKGNIIRPEFMYKAWARLTPLKVAEGEDAASANLTQRNYWIIDDSHTGVYQVDQKTVYVPFDLLQKDLDMGPQPYIDRLSGENKIAPARCNEIDIALKPGYSLADAKEKIQKIVDATVQQYPDLVFGPDDPVAVQTWEERYADFLNAVEHEKFLLVILFSIISVVAVFLIFCIFFMIVVEKTRDIGIIKSVGATPGGVAAIFLGYGLTIGIVGAGMGLLFGYLVIHNINEIHAWIGREFGVKIWDAKTYLFDKIPSTMETRDVVVIVSVAILSSVLGAIVPAIRAARMNPVEALRWE
jgi:lipoprotein-releasing system permease protein